jgi:uncharacterized protein DUF2188
MQAASLLAGFMNIRRPSGPLLETRPTIDEMAACLWYELGCGGNRRLRYFVVHDKGQWKINFQGQHYGPYFTQGQAIADAANAARRDHSQGFDAEVLVQNERGRFRVEWTYGHDPYPPFG